MRAQQKRDALEPLRILTIDIDPIEFPINLPTHDMRSCEKTAYVRRAMFAGPLTLH